MMPDPDRELVDHIFRCLFGTHPERDDLRAVLHEAAQPASPRVQLAVLKLSEGDSEKLLSYVEIARTDYRDVLAYAEYPEEMRAGPTKRTLGDDALAQIRRRDRAQYEIWLASFS